MEICSWLKWQIDYLLILQNFRDLSNHIFDNFFLFITSLGEITIPILIITFIYWCVNKKAGQFLLWNYALGFIINNALKITACIYRPWILSSSIHPVPQAIPGAGGYSFPSGHTTVAVALWGGLAFWWRKYKIILIPSLIILPLIMFSRNYLGVHTPQDIIVSFIIGIFLLFGISKIMDYIDNNKNGDIIVATAITAIVSLSIPYLLLKSYPCHYLNGKILYDTFGMKLSSAARLMWVVGVFWGYLIEKRFVKFSPEQGSITNKILRYISGVVVLSLLMHLTKYASAFGNIFINNMAIHFIIGLFITFIHPAISGKLCR